MPVFIRRRTDGDELDIPVRHARFGIGSEMQTAGLIVLLHQRRQARFKNRDIFQVFDFSLIDVNAHNVMANFSQHGGLHQTHITNTKTVTFM